MRKFRMAALGAAVIALVASAPFQADRYQLDKAHTYIGFNVKHLGVTNVKGKFNSFAGEIMLDQADITKSSALVTISAASIDTDNERRDNHLRSDDFLNAEQYPNITFVSKRVQKTPGGMTMTGDLTIRDVTREIVVPFVISGPIASATGQKRLGAEATLVIDRFDYGLKYNRITEAVAVVGAEVRIELNVEAATPRPPRAP